MPIRIGFIGLGRPATGILASGAWGAIAHLPGILQQSSDYEITALCNTSVEAAQASIQYHGLLATTKTYADATKLANDPDVDLVVITVFIGKHFELAKTALEAGKMVYVEAPLAASLAEAEELAALAKAQGVRTMVATQGRASPAVALVRKAIATEEIGEIVSSSVVARFSSIGSAQLVPVELKWILELDNVGNSLLISFGHFFDTHQALLGGFSSYNAYVENKGTPRVLVDDKGNQIESVKATSPDHVFIQGKLQSGALASIAWRSNVKSIDGRKPDLSDHSPFRWIITGTDGEVEITTPSVSWQMTGHLPKVFMTKKAVTTELEIPKEHQDLQYITENTASQYVAFAKGDKSRYADFEDAAKLASVMEELRQVGLMAPMS